MFIKQPQSWIINNIFVVGGNFGGTHTAIDNLKKIGK